MHTERRLPRSHQIARRILAEIQSGEIAPGEYLPSVRSLARREKISTATAMRVHQIVRLDAPLTVVPGLGTMVSHPAEALTD